MFTKNSPLSTDLSTRIPQTRSIFLGIVHFGDRGVTDRAISSVKTGSLEPEHVFVVDHGDTSSSLSNTGYACGLAEAVEKAGSLGANEHDLLVVMNNDAVVVQDGMRQLNEWWDTHGSSKTIASPSWGSVSLLTGRARITGEKRRSIFSVLYLHGSCFVMEYGLAKTLSIPTDLFLYWEDVMLGLCHKGKLARIPFPLIQHADTAMPISEDKLYYLVRNGAYVLERKVALVWRMYWYVINSIRYVYHILANHVVIRQALSDARYGRLGRRKV